MRDGMTATNDSPRVYIVDDDLGVSEGISDYLASKGINSCCFDRCERFLELWKDEGPACLILDYQLPGMSGVELQAKLKALHIQIPIIFMTAYSDVSMVRTVMKAGAIDFLTKPFSMDELLKAVHLSLKLDSEHRERAQGRKQLTVCLQSLTEREQQVLDLVIGGLLNKQIAAELGISEVMVKEHRRHMMDKMQSESVSELVRRISLLSAN